MSALGERTLMQHLVDLDSITVLVDQGLPAECIPTEPFRDIVTWVVDYYFDGGRMTAPSLEALRGVSINKTTFGEILDDYEIPMEEEPEDSVEWAIEDLKGTFVMKEGQAFTRTLATDLANAETGERIAVIDAAATDLTLLAIGLKPKRSRVDVREAGADALLRYEAREATRADFRGMQLGLDAIDKHTYGIHDGELAVLAAPPKTGKSYGLAWAALAEHKAGRSVVLNTLENSVEMTVDRLACLACGVDSDRWQRGLCVPEEVEAVREWVEEMKAWDIPLWVLQPDLGQRSFEHMVREATLLEADSLMIDQLTFVEVERRDDRRSTQKQIGDALHRLKGMISTGHHRMPCYLAHQINRDGQKAAEKVGRLEMYHLAEASEIERTCDWVFGMYASKDQEIARRVMFQTLATRRASKKHWELGWEPEAGLIEVRQEITL